MYVAYCKVDAQQVPLVKTVLGWGTVEAGVKKVRCADHSSVEIGDFNLSDVEWSGVYVEGDPQATVNNIKNNYDSRFAP